MGQGNIRNKYCHCGSGKKYKFCCMRKEDAIKREEINKKISSALRSFRAKECLYPDHSNCKGKIIEAHSIQNNKTLSKISENGEVMMISHDATEFDFKVRAKKIGRSRATVFTGFCGYHDKTVFQSIEDNVYTPGDLEQNALFAYRAFAKEFHAKLSAYNFFKDHEGDGLAGNEAAKRDADYYQNVFGRMFKEKDFGLVETKYISLPDEFDFAVSGGITFNYDFIGNQVNDLLDLEKRAVSVFVTIFPENGKTNFLFSYLSEDSSFFEFLDEQLVNIDDKNFKIRISNLVTLMENIVISPILWSKVGESSQKIVLSRFEKNLKEEDVPGELSVDHGFNFFI